MRTEFSRMITVTTPDGGADKYPLCCREEAAGNLALDMFFDSAAALDAFMVWLASEDPAAALADRDEIDALFDEWTGYTAGDMIDEAMKTGRSAAYGYTVEVSADEQPYTVMHDGVVEC